MAPDLDRWVGKVAIVTGASSGIGAAIVEKLVKAGVIVVGFARRKEYMDDLSEKLAGCRGKLYSVRVDMTRESDILTGFKWTRDNIGPAHILINNAGVIKNSSLGTGDTRLWREVFDTNVIGLCIATREAVLAMKANEIEGQIIHVNSVFGHKVVYFENSNVYSASKYAVTSLAESLRQEFNLSDCRIKISCVSPGAVDTSILTNNRMSKEMQRNLEVGYKLKSDDVADSIMYILSTPPNVLIQDVILRSVLEKF